MPCVHGCAVVSGEIKVYLVARLAFAALLKWKWYGRLFGGSSTTGV